MSITTKLKIQLVSLVLILLPASLFAGYATMFSAGGEHVVAVDWDGTVYAWGTGLIGEDLWNQGWLDPVERTSPEIFDPNGLLTGKTITALASGSKHSLALTSENELFTLVGCLTGFDGPDCGEFFEPEEGFTAVPVDMSGVLAGKTITKISAAGDHNLVLTSDNGVYAWGTNTYGQLGNGSTTNSGVPVAVDMTGVLAGKTVTHIVAGLSHSLVLTSDGGLYSWGDNTNGQLGNGTTTASSVPVAVDQTGVLSGKTIIDIDAGWFISGVVSSDGAVFTWGKNSYAELGDGTTIERHVPVAVDMTTSSLAGKTVTDIAGGSYFIVLAQDGSIHTIGCDNVWGAAGSGNSDDSTVPVAVDMSGVLAGKTITDIDWTGDGFQGSGHARASDGSLYAWGVGRDGQLGNGTDDPALSPVATNYFTGPQPPAPSSVLFPTNGETGVSARPVLEWTSNANITGHRISLGTDNPPTNILDGVSGGTFGLWWSHIAPGLEHNTTYYWSVTPYNEGGDAIGVEVWSFTTEFAGHKFDLIEAGNAHVLAGSFNQDDLFAWGDNTYGQLGNGTTINSHVPVLVDTTGVMSGKTIMAVAGGAGFSVALSYENGEGAELFTWGDNTYGQLGNGNNTSSSVPVAVDMTGVLAGKAIRAISAGMYHCLVLDSEGKLYSWGYNAEGQLGNGSFVNSNVPVAVDMTGVLAGKSVTDIAAAQDHNLVLSTEGLPYTWGDNAFGQLGNNSTTASAVPIAVDVSGVLAGKTITNVSAAYAHNLVLTNEGSGNVYAWGSNLFGECGVGSNVNQLVPVAVDVASAGASSSINRIEAGYLTSFVATTSSDELYTWGDNTYGQLGNGTTTSSNVPVAVDMSGVLDGESLDHIAASSFSMAVRASGFKAFAWGANLVGQLGNGTNINSSVPVAVNPLIAPPGIAELSAPADGATGVGIDHDLTWQATDGATGYRVSFGTDNPPTNIANDSDLGNVLSYTPATVNSTTYYWSITPYNEVGEATGVPVWSFTTSDPVPAPVNFVSPTPEDGSINAPLGALIIWELSEGATGYYFNLGTDNPPTNLITLDLVGDHTFFQNPSLTSDYNTTYYYETIPYNAAGSAVGVEVRSFTTTGPPPLAATTPTPADAATEVALNSELGWAASADATGYKVSFGTDNPPTNIANGTDLGNALTYSLTTEYSTTYYWSITPYNVAGDASEVPVWSFTTMDETIVEGSTCEDPIDAVAGTNSATGADQWFVYTATGDGSITVSSDGTDQDTKVWVWDACDGANIAYNDDIDFVNLASEVTFESTAGVAYKIFWDDQYGPGAFDWTLTETVGPELLPDFVVSTMWAEDGAVIATVTNQGTADSEGFLGGGTDFHKWSIDGSLVSSYASGPALAMGASATFSLPGFTYEEVGAGTFDVAFHADIDNDIEELDEENNVGHFDMLVEMPPPVPQNLVAEAGYGSVNLTWEPAGYPGEGVMRANGVPSVFNQKGMQKLRGSREPRQKVSAFREAGDTCGEAIVASVGINSATGADQWFEYTATTNGSITVSSDGTDQDTKLYVYDACDGAEIAFHDDIDYPANPASVVTFNSTAGVSYKIFWDDEWGPGAFDWTLTETGGELPMPDFVVSDMWAMADTVFATVTNQGTADSQGFLNAGTDYHKWSIDGTMESGYATGPALAMGASATFHLSGFTFEAMGAGTYDVAFHADVDNDTDELNEENNISHFDMVIDGPGYIPTYTIYRDEAAIASDVSDLFYQDEGLESGTEYCYTVTQQMEDLSESGHSNLACAIPEAPPLGDLCDNPFLLTLPVVGEVGSSDGFANDYSGWSYMSGIDIVYAFSIPEDGTISGSIVDGGGEWTAMFVMEACPDVGDEVIALASGSSGGSFAYEPISAGDYFLIVSNWPTPDAFSYTFDLSFMPGPPPMVELLSPVEDMMVSTLTPEFLWESFVNPEDEAPLLRVVDQSKADILADENSDDQTVYQTIGYDFYLGTQADLSDAAPVEVVGNSYTPMDDLMENQVYYWAVSAVDDDGSLTYSDTASFWTNSMIEAPSEFTLLTPGADEEMSILDPVFSWSHSWDPDIGDAVHYTLIIGESWDDLDTITSIMDTSFTTEWSLEDNTTYRWRVFAEDNSGLITSNVGGYQEFSTNLGNDNPSMVNLISPDSVRILTLTPEMYWTPALDPDPNDNLTYEMHWWADDIEYDSVLTDTNLVVLPRELEDNTQYFWEVIALDDQDGISHSTSKTFWTDLIPEAPLGFALLTPENNSTGLTETPEFSWEQAIDPDPLDYATYTLQIARDSDFADVVFEVHTEADAEFQMTETLSMDTDYWWRVIATDTDDQSTESEIFKITVGTVSIAEGLALPTEYVMDQNFPNPFNPSTTIRYGLPEDSNVSLVIYDVRGNVIRTLESGTRSAGWYELVWDGRSNEGITISTGLYLARISAGDYDEVIKMLYLK